MKIGIVGSSGTIELLKQNIKHDMLFLDISYYPLPQNTTDLGGFLSAVQHELDGILFTGRTYFDRASRCASSVIPWTYFKRSKTSLLYALIRARNMGFDISKITFDSSHMTTNDLLEILVNCFEIEEKQIILHSFHETKAYEDYTAALFYNRTLKESYLSLASTFHLKNFQNGEATICLSSSPYMQSSPALAEYPTFLVKLSTEDVMDALNEIRFRCMEKEKQAADPSRIAVVSLKVEMAEPYTHVIQENQQLTGTYHVEKELLALVQEMSASIEKTSDLQYIIYTNKDILYNKTMDLKKLSFAEKLLSIVGVHKISIGIGIGETHQEAKHNSLQARTAAKNQSNSCYYLSNRNGKTQGPFLIRRRRLQKDFQEVAMEKVSSETGVSIVILNAMIKAQNQYGFERITVGELAEMCNVSFNTMNRNITSLEEKGYVQIVGQITRAKTGRPRRLIELKLGFLRKE